MVNIAKFISIAVHKEIVLFIHKLQLVDSYRLNFSCCNFGLPLRFVHHGLFCFTFCFISIYSFNNFLRANKKVLSIQSTVHASEDRFIFDTFSVSFDGLKTAII